jgi:uncharacterized secreted protein with C-terminal beta-propeller domain
MKRMAITALLLTALIFSIVACTPTTPPSGNGTYVPYQAPDAKLEGAKSFSSDAELLAFIRSNSGGNNYGGYYRNEVMLGEFQALKTTSDVVAAPTAAGTSSSGSAAVPSPDHSTTNNQVVGVDEADIIKTDGNYIYTVTGNTVFIVKAYPGEDAKVVSTIDLKSVPQGLFIQGDHLAVMGNFYDPDYFKKIDFVPRQGMSFLTIYDVSDKGHPKSVKEYKFEGIYFDARMTNGEIYLVVQSQPIYRIEHPTPIIIDGSTVGAVPVGDVKYYPIPYNNPQFTTVHAVSMESPDRLNSKTVTTEWTNTLYMSEDNIYITYADTVNEWETRQQVIQDLLQDQLTATDRALIDKIKNTDDEVLSRAEKESKIFQIYQNYVSYAMGSDEQQAFQERVDNKTQTLLSQYEALTYTVIDRISAKDGELSLAATGQVPGTVNNQFSLDEYDNVLRVATTIQQNRWIEPMRGDIAVASGGVATADAKMVAEPAIAIMPPRPIWQWQTTNNVYTLDMDLKVLDKLTGLEPGEQIYSTRFMGERLYMVTFRQTDPFLVVDLSNPDSIKLLGNLTLPGFSRYLHPYDGDTIIGIGQETSATGRQTGLKISLFDVSDVKHPKEVAKFVADGDYSQSTAEWEHKAFLFDKEKQLLVIPAYSYSYNSLGGDRQHYNGAMVFKITPTDIEIRGIIDHSKGTEGQYYGSMVERSLWIGGLLYTKSPNLLRINALSDLSSVQNVTLTPKNAGPYPVY